MRNTHIPKCSVKLCSCSRIPVSKARFDLGLQCATKKKRCTLQATYQNLFTPALLWAMGACDGSQMTYLVVQEQLATLNCLVEMNRWNPGAGHALTRSIIMVSHAVKNSLQGMPNQFTATQLLQVICMPSRSQSLNCCITNDARSIQLLGSQ